MTRSHTTAPVIRAFEDGDWPGLWTILAPVFRAGETYCVDPAIEEATARAYWIDAPAATFVAVDDDGAPLGSYYLKANQPPPGAHVANCGYVVGAEARGRGVASAMCEHSQETARAHGFAAMQYNFVVSTNIGAIRLWQRHGFAIVGTLPAAFDHPQAGRVDAHVMHKPLC